MMNAQAMAAQPSMVDHHRGLVRDAFGFPHAYSTLHYVQHQHQHHQAPHSRTGSGGLSMPTSLHLESNSLRLHHQHQQHLQQQQFVAALSSKHHQQHQQHQHQHQQQQQQLPTPSSEIGNAFDDLPPPNYEGFPTRPEFENLLNEYILSLSPKKRDKALIPQKRYDNILAVLRDPKCTTIESAQFRFWAKKMFRLVPDTDNIGVVCHEGKPVAVREELYRVLTSSHGQAQHGGRDKTSAQVRKYYSWVPKELIARFVRNCPSCTLRRSSPLEYAVANTARNTSQALDASPTYITAPSSANITPASTRRSSLGSPTQQQQQQQQLQVSLISNSPVSATTGGAGPGSSFYSFSNEVMPLDPRIVYNPNPPN